MSKYQHYKPKVVVKWVTPNGDQMVADLARVSVKDGDGKPVEKLIKYMADNNHWSPFDMVNLCVEVHAPRDISRQILRHWSIHPQEFSQRYAEVADDMFVLRGARTQHPTNRQMSVDTESQELVEWWELVQTTHVNDAMTRYKAALAKGVAKEQARVLLPEGNTMSKLYLNGTLRSWITYLKVRQDIDATQREHVWVANEIAVLVQTHFPQVHAAFFQPPRVYEVLSSAIRHPNFGNVPDGATLAKLVEEYTERHTKFHVPVVKVDWQPAAGTARVILSSTQHNYHDVIDFKIFYQE